MSLRTADGWYEPGFFSIGIETDEKIDNAILHNTGTFIHEYIHFLQDITLPYLLRQSEIFYASFSSVIEDAISKGILVRPFENWSEDIKSTTLQREYTLGNEHPENYNDNIGKITNVRCAEYFNNKNIHNVYKYYLEIDDGRDYHIGAVDFYEYIAAKLENKFYNKSHTQLPYYTMDYLFDYYELSDIPDESRIYIIEYCLYNDHPIRFFCNLVIDMVKQNKETFIDYRKCRDMLSRLGWQSRGHQNENIFIKTDRRINQLMSSLNKIYDPILYPSINKWVNTALDFSKNILASSFIFSELYCLDKEKFESTILECINKIGIPLIFNKNDDLFSLLPKEADYNYDEFLDLHIINMFMRLITMNGYDCPINPICSRMNKNKMNDNCLDIRNINSNNHQKCYFSNFLDKHKINNIKWKVKIP
jgi:hypothetical protein